MTRALKRIICRALIGVMLFAQLAVAAHACALLAAATPAQPAAGVADDRAAPGDAALNMSDMSGMAVCDRLPGSLDAASPNLCAEHCGYGQQTDQTAKLTVPAAVMTSLYTVPAAPEGGVRSAMPRGPADGARAAATAPLNILHCRFRD